MPPPIWQGGPDTMLSILRDGQLSPAVFPDCGPGRCVGHNIPPNWEAGAAVVIAVLWLRKPTPKGAAAGAAVPHEGPQSLITCCGRLGWQKTGPQLVRKRPEVL